MNSVQTKIKTNDVATLLKWTQICGFAGLLFLTGCSSDGGAPVNVDVAQTTLASAMEGWKEGKTPKDLLEEKPPIVVQEMDWNSETKLLDYEIVNDDSPTGPNLIATVKLKLSKSDGKVVEKIATYVVGTSPGLTVYRNTMR